MNFLSSAPSITLVLTSLSIIAYRDEQTDFTIGEIEHLMDLLIAVGEEIHNRGSRARRNGRMAATRWKLRTTPDRPSFAFTNFGAGLPNTSIARLTTAMMLMASLHWPTAPLSGTRQCAIQDLAFSLHHAVKDLCQFAGWVVLLEASISSVVPPLWAR